SMIAQGSQPLALALAGPLADRVFVPLMTRDSPLGNTLQGWLGTGEGSGYGLFFIAVGTFTVLLAVAGWFYRPLRFLEAEIPDVDGLPTVGDPDTVGEMGVT
ncbi:MAG: hypothetical protein M3094_01340, partial [Actinomycetia bacterium]|nr:hypothetical protein [Actinomycetes bacterium]